eukprot:5747643-Pyramimonas_sp.AAC.1
MQRRSAMRQRCVSDASAMRQRCTSDVSAVAHQIPTRSLNEYVPEMRVPQDPKFDFNAASRKRPRWGADAAERGARRRGGTT